MEERVILQFTAVIEDKKGLDTPTLVNFRVIGPDGENHPLILVGKEFALRKGGSATHYVVQFGVTKVEVVSIKDPFIHWWFRYDETVEVRVVGFKDGVEGLPHGICNYFWVSPEDLEEIPKVSETDADKPPALPSEDEEVPEDGTPEKGYGV